jgi:hypothetical protein
MARPDVFPGRFRFGGEVTQGAAPTLAVPPTAAGEPRVHRRVAGSKVELSRSDHNLH